MTRRPRTLPAALRLGFAGWARSELGLRFPDGREDSLDDAVLQAAAELGVDAGVLLEALRRGDARAAAAFVARATVGETFFFRDPQHFELLGELLAAADGPVTLWSAGCANGAEAYSMAIVALERFGERAADRVRIVATDINDAALAVARAGRFRDWALRGIDDARKRRWLRPVGRLWAIDPRAAALVSFSHHNLAADDGSGPRGVDLAFCRNVLVYFDQAAIARAAATLRDALSPAGLLITGPSDPLLSDCGLAVESSRGFLAYRRPRADAAEPAPVRAPLEMLRRAELPLRPAPAAAPAPRPAIAPAPSLERAQALAAAGDTGAAVAEIDRYLRDHSLSAPGFLLRGFLHQSAGEPARAREDLRRALLIDRGLAYAHLVAAYCHVSLGERDEARRALHKSKALAAARPADELLDPVSQWTAEELLSACRDLEAALSR